MNLIPLSKKDETQWQKFIKSAIVYCTSLMRGHEDIKNVKRTWSLMVFGYFFLEFFEVFPQKNMYFTFILLYDSRYSVNITRITK